MSVVLVNECEMWSKSRKTTFAFTFEATVGCWLFGGSVNSADSKENTKNRNCRVWVFTAELRPLIVTDASQTTTAAVLVLIFLPRFHGISAESPICYACISLALVFGVVTMPARAAYSSLTH